KKHTCTGSTCGIDLTKSGAACSDTTGGKFCNGKGSCVQCLVHADCPGEKVCSNGACVPGNCADMVKNGAETDVDCGGNTCTPCVNGKDCLKPGDCVSRVCAGPGGGTGGAGGGGGAGGAGGAGGTGGAASSSAASSGAGGAKSGG